MAVGTNMTQKDYEHLEQSANKLLNETEARALINKEFGFEFSQIDLVCEVDVWELDETTKKYVHKAKHHRQPLFDAWDWNYIILAGKELHIADLKYGKGVAVDAVENPQQRLYALGALQEYGDIYEIEQITTHIVQPRLNSITTENLTRDELESWGEAIKPVAADAYKDTRLYKAGEHCQFCRARATCRERARHYLSSVLEILGGQK